MNVFTSDSLLSDEKVLRDWDSDTNLDPIITA